MISSRRRDKKSPKSSKTAVSKLTLVLKELIERERLALNQQREQKDEILFEEQWAVIDATFNTDFNNLQASLISWPELLKDTADKAPFFT